MATTLRRVDEFRLLVEAARERAFQDAAVHSGCRFELERIERAGSMLPKPSSSPAIRMLDRLSGSGTHAIRKSVDCRRDRVFAACRDAEIAAILSEQTLRTHQANYLEARAWGEKVLALLEWRSTNANNQHDVLMPSEVRA